jgi:predicted nucleic acid-binding protein
MKKVFIDSDIVLDVATARDPFFVDSTNSLSLIENGYALGVVSSNSVTNIYYILRKLSSNKKAKEFIGTLLEYISVISIDHDSIKRALDSKFIDFEDGVQHFCAVKNMCDLILTRNVKDYAFSEIEVFEPKEFIELFNNK